MKISDVISIIGNYLSVIQLTYHCYNLMSNI